MLKIIFESYSYNFQWWFFLSSCTGNVKELWRSRQWGVWEGKEGGGGGSLSNGDGDPPYRRAEVLLHQWSIWQALSLPPSSSFNPETLVIPFLHSLSYSDTIHHLLWKRSIWAIPILHLPNVHRVAEGLRAESVYRIKSYFMTPLRPPLSQAAVQRYFKPRAIVDKTSRVCLFTKRSNNPLANFNREYLRTLVYPLLGDIPFLH